MRFRFVWGSTTNMFRLLLSKNTVLVQEIIAAPWLNWALPSPWLISVLFLCECSLLQGLMHMPDANNLLQRAAIINAAPWNFSTLALDLLVSSQWSGLCVKIFSECAILDSAWCNNLMQRAAIINAAPWNSGLVDCLAWFLTWSDCENTWTLSEKFSTLQ